MKVVVAVRITVWCDVCSMVSVVYLQEQASTSTSAGAGKRKRGAAAKVSCLQTDSL